mgnify:CR=1 FL=1
MSLINNIIRAIFGGTKSEKDIKEILPLVAQINEIEQKLNAGTTDELRAATKKLQQKIADAIKPQEEKIAELQAKLEEEDITSVDERESMYDTIDALKKETDEIVAKTAFPLMIMRVPIMVRLPLCVPNLFKYRFGTMC